MLGCNNLPENIFSLFFGVILFVDSAICKYKDSDIIIHTAATDFLSGQRL
jgi:hypothetical protein